MKTYVAMVWPEGSDHPGKRVSISADSLDKARRLLEAEFGEGSILDLHCEEDAARPR